MRIFNDQARLILAMLIGLMQSSSSDAVEKQITHAQHGHILTNTAVWSPDSQWIVYDVRSDPAGNLFDSDRIERVNVNSGEVQVVFESENNAHCGVATYCPTGSQVVFIHGPENPNDSWGYAAFHRRGVIVDTDRSGIGTNLDARNIVPPFTPGALRGGTHVHTFSGDGRWVAFTYEDHVLASNSNAQSRDKNQRNVGVSVSGHPVVVPSTHDRNHNGTHFSVLATQTQNDPKPGSDQISRAFSDAWIGTAGYIRDDGSRQQKAIAFQGHVVTKSGDTIAEVFIVDLPNDVTQPGVHGSLEGTLDHRPQPPNGTTQRRLTFTADREYPGIQGVRHWMRSSPDGSQIAFLMKDDNGVSQLWAVSPNGGEPKQMSKNEHDVASTFSWSPDGGWISFVMDGSVCRTDVPTGTTHRLTDAKASSPLRKEACVVSPDGSQVAYLRQVTEGGETWNQIFVASAQ